LPIGVSAWPPAFDGVRFDEGGDPVVQFIAAIVASTSLMSKV
jgi:hypothetical protein